MTLFMLAKSQKVKIEMLFNFRYFVNFKKVERCARYVLQLGDLQWCQNIYMTLTCNEILRDSVCDGVLWGFLIITQHKVALFELGLLYLSLP